MRGVIIDCSVFISTYTHAQKSFISHIIPNNRYNLYSAIYPLKPVTIYKKI